MLSKVMGWVSKYATKYSNELFWFDIALCGFVGVSAVVDVSWGKTAGLFVLIDMVRRVVLKLNPKV